ncbi:hypothetical protein CBL_09247 [Carabus blaptoides fortunei]
MSYQFGIKRSVACKFLRTRFLSKLKYTCCGCDWTLMLGVALGFSKFCATYGQTESSQQQSVSAEYSARIEWCDVASGSFISPCNWKGRRRTPEGLNPLLYPWYNPFRVSLILKPSIAATNDNPREQ